MKTMIYCEVTNAGEHAFYLIDGNERYYLFSQKFKYGVQKYFSKGVSLRDSTNFSKSHNDSALRKTMSKIPLYIKYIEKSYEVEIYEQTKRRNRLSQANLRKCA